MCNKPLEKKSKLHTSVSNPDKEDIYDAALEMGKIKKDKTTKRGQWHKARSIKVTLIMDPSLTRVDSNLIRKLGMENKLYKARIPFEIRNTNPEDFRNTIWNHFYSIRGQPFSLWKMNKNNPDLVLLPSSIRTSQDLCASEDLNRSHLYIKPLDLNCDEQTISSSSSSNEPENLSSQCGTVQQSCNYFYNRDEPCCSSLLAPLSISVINADAEGSCSPNIPDENSSDSDIDDGPMEHMNIAPNIPKNEPNINAAATTQLLSSTSHFTFPDTSSHNSSEAYTLLSVGPSEGPLYRRGDQLAEPSSTINPSNDIVPIGNNLLPADPLLYEGLSYATHSSGQDIMWTEQADTESFRLVNSISNRSKWKMKPYSELLTNAELYRNQYDENCSQHVRASFVNSDILINSGTSATEHMQPRSESLNISKFPNELQTLTSTALPNNSVRSTVQTNDLSLSRNAMRIEQQGPNEGQLPQDIATSSRPISNHQNIADGYVQSDSVYLLKCLICYKVLQDAVTLPCLDSFCLSCIKLKINNEEDLRNCPICAKGYDKTLLTEPLQYPYVRFTRKAVKLYRIENIEEDDKICEACEAANAAPAVWFCMDCNSKFCQSCLRGHDLAMKIITGPNGHTVVTLGSALRCQIRSIQTECEERCQLHPYNNVELLCNTCEKLCCYTCVGETCLDHEMTAPERFKSDLNIIHKSVKSRSDNIDKLLKIFNEFNTGMERTSDKIIKMAEDFIAKITEWKLQMLENLKEAAEKQDLKSHGLQINAVSRFNNKLSKYLESIRQYGSLRDIIEFKGTIANTNSDIDDMYSRLQLTPVIMNILFSPRLDKPISMESKIDEPFLRGSFTVAIKSNETRIKNFWKNDGDSWKYLGGFWEKRGGVAVLDKKIFVTRRDQPVVDVYDSQILTMLHRINIPDMINYQCDRHLAGCAYNRALYISDIDWLGKNSCIHRVDLTNNSATSWKMREKHYPGKLSVTAEHTLLVTVWNDYWCVEGDVVFESIIMEYSSEGQLLREIKLEESIKHAWHTVQLSSDQFIVCHGIRSPSQGVCVVNTEGQLIKCFGGKIGGGEYPTSLAVDHSRKHIFAAYSNNNRVLVLDTDLTYLGEVHVAPDLKEPYFLCIDSSTDRLFVSEWFGRLFVVSLPQITYKIKTV